MLQGQSKTIAEILVKALTEHNTISINECSSRLVTLRGRIEELMWVLNKKIESSNSLEVYTINIPGNKAETLTVGQILEKLKIGELTMNDLQPEICDKVRKVAAQSKTVNQK